LARKTEQGKNKMHEQVHIKRRILRILSGVVLEKTIWGMQKVDLFSHRPQNTGHMLNEPRWGQLPPPPAPT